MKNLFSNIRIRWSQKKQKGFTLVEALVAIFILTIAIVTPLQIAYQGIAATTYAKNKLVAQYLAQDATEFLLARQLENSSDWTTGFSNCLTSDGCALPTDSFTQESGDVSIACPSGNCPVMNYKASTGQYSQNQHGQSGWADTSFTRNVKLKVIDADAEEVQATVTVSWGTSLSNKIFIIRENYYGTGPNSGPPGSGGGGGGGGGSNADTSYCEANPNGSANLNDQSVEPPCSSSRHVSFTVPTSDLQGDGSEGFDADCAATLSPVIQGSNTTFSVDLPLTWDDGTWDYDRVVCTGLSGGSLDISIPLSSSCAVDNPQVTSKIGSNGYSVDIIGPSWGWEFPATVSSNNLFCPPNGTYAPNVLYNHGTSDVED